MPNLSCFKKYHQPPKLKSKYLKEISYGGLLAFVKGCGLKGAFPKTFEKKNISCFELY